jgi:ABC-type glycerol-3-phosphate transport system permease component
VAIVKHQFRVVFIVLVFIVVAVVWLVPFWWMVITSLKTPQEILKYPPTLFPMKISWKSYLTIFSRVPLLSFFKNSILTALTVTFVAVFTSTLGGYIFAKFRFRGKEVIFLLILSTIMIPLTVLVIPLYLMAIAVGLKNTLLALIIPGFVNALGIFFMRNYLYSIPDSYIEVARIDGCKEFLIYFRVILPLCKPALAAIAIFVFMENWDSFFWPLIVIDQVSRRTLPLGLGLFTQAFGVQDWNLIMAATLVSMLPFLLFFLVFQRHFIKGITMTGLKG